MGVVIQPESELGKELAKWNKPWVYVRFPQMLYKAFKRENGKVQCMEPPPVMAHFVTMPEYQRAEALAEAFTRQCQHTVQNDAEYDRARQNGWRDSVPEALAVFEAFEQDIARAAAEAAFQAQRMTAQAREELQRAESATSEHVVDLVSAPKRSPKKARAIVPAEDR